MRFQPRLNLAAEASVTLDVAATLGLQFTGGFQARIGYDGDASASADFSTSISLTEATVDGELTISSSVTPGFVLDILLYATVNTNITLQATLAFEAVGVLSLNFVDDEETVALTSFDVDVIFEIPATLRVIVPSIFADDSLLFFDLGNIFESTLEVLSLPTVEIESDGPATCIAGGDVELTLVAVEGPYTALIANSAETPTAWDVDTTGWVVSQVEDYRATLLSSSLGVPSGSVDFRATPTYPRIPYAITAPTG